MRNNIAFSSELDERKIAGDLQVSSTVGAIESLSKTLYIFKVLLSKALACLLTGEERQLLPTDLCLLTPTTY